MNLVVCEFVTIRLDVACRRMRERNSLDAKRFQFLGVRDRMRGDISPNGWPNPVHQKRLRDGRAHGRL